MLILIKKVYVWSTYYRAMVVKFQWQKNVMNQRFQGVRFSHKAESVDKS